MGLLPLLSGSFLGAQPFGLRMKPRVLLIGESANKYVIDGIRKILKEHPAVEYVK